MVYMVEKDICPNIQIHKAYACPFLKKFRHHKIPPTFTNLFYTPSFSHDWTSLFPNLHIKSLSAEIE